MGSNFLESAKVVDVKSIGNAYFILTVKSHLLEQGKNSPKPGQFYMLGVNDTDKILKRPISLHYSNKSTGELQFFIKKVGAGTNSIAQLKPGQSIDVQGPLGRGFIFDQIKGNVVIVAGGIGLAPFKDVIPQLEKNDNVKQINFIAAGQNSDINEIINRFDIKSNGKTKITFCTDDGSCGIKGNAVEALEQIYKEKTDKYDYILSCGPTPMLNGVGKFAKQNKIPYQFSFESRMGCGVGACEGCTIETVMGLKKICKDGPVFLNSELVEGN